MCINILVDIYQGDSCDDDDLGGNESLIQEVELDADQVSRLPRGLLESPPREHFESMRMQCAELSRSELDLTILGQISALLSNDPNTKSHRQETPRRRSSMAFYHRGVRVCRMTFQKLHGIGMH